MTCVPLATIALPQASSFIPLRPICCFVCFICLSPWRKTAKRYEILFEYLPKFYQAATAYFYPFYVILQGWTIWQQLLFQWQWIWFLPRLPRRGRQARRPLTISRADILSWQLHHQISHQLFNKDNNIPLSRRHMGTNFSSSSKACTTTGTRTVPNKTES